MVKKVQIGVTSRVSSSASDKKASNSQGSTEQLRMVSGNQESVEQPAERKETSGTPSS